MITVNDYKYCSSRLPCGICRLTNSLCPKVPYYDTAINFGTYTTKTTGTTTTTSSIKCDPSTTDCTHY